MKNVSVIVLFLILCLTVSLKIEHQQVPTSGSTTPSGGSTNTSNTTHPSSNTTTPAQPATPASPGTPGTPAQPATPATPVAPAADDLTADEKKEYDAWKKNLVPWAKFENGEDKSAFFDSEVEKKYGLAKKEEIKAKRPKK